MASNSSDLSFLVEEYGVIAKEARVRDLKSDSLRARLESLLTNEAGWTQQGAAELIAVVADYGSFFLRNAAALALALGVEDGEKGL